MLHRSDTVKRNVNGRAQHNPFWWSSRAACSSSSGGSFFASSLLRQMKSVGRILSLGGTAGDLGSWNRSSYGI